MIVSVAIKTNIVNYLQKRGEKSTKRVNSSRRPKSIPIDKIHLAVSERGWNVPIGPMMSPSPGPTFDMDVAAPESDVVISSPVRRRHNAIAAKESR